MVDFDCVLLILVNGLYLIKMEVILWLVIRKWEYDPEGEIFDAPLDVTFNDITVVQPDLFYVSGEQKFIVKDTRIDGPPTLVVEILSPSNSRKDRLQKLQIYQGVKVQHYWLVNPEEKTPDCFSLRDSTYSLVAVGMDEDVVRTSEFCRVIHCIKNLVVDL